MKEKRRKLRFKPNDLVVIAQLTFDFLDSSINGKRGLIKYVDEHRGFATVLLCDNGREVTIDLEALERDHAQNKENTPG